LPPAWAPFGGSFYSLGARVAPRSPAFSPFGGRFTRSVLGPPLALWAFGRGVFSLVVRARGSRSGRLSAVFFVGCTSEGLAPPLALRALFAPLGGSFTSEGLAPPLALLCGKGAVGASKPAPRRPPCIPRRPPGFNVGYGRSIENTSGAMRFGVAPSPTPAARDPRGSACGCLGAWGVGGLCARGSGMGSRK
jgi:hypothetical protein